MSPHLLGRPAERLVAAREPVCRHVRLDRPLVLHEWLSAQHDRAYYSGPFVLVRKTLALRAADSAVAGIPEFSNDVLATDALSRLD